MKYAHCVVETRTNLTIAPSFPLRKKIQLVVQKFEDTGINLQSKGPTSLGSTHPP